MPHALAHPVVARMKLRRRVKVGLLYARAILGEFKWTLIVMLCLVVLGATLHRMTPGNLLTDNQRCSVGDSIYAGWMALLAQPQYTKCPWYLKVVYALYPVMGFILFGEGVVRLALLMVSKRRGEKEWMQVVASTYRDHVILCGLGHLGYRVLEQLVASNAPTVVLEKSKGNPFLAQAKAMRVPILIRDMKDDAALVEAGVEHATAIIICTNDEMLNLEVALDARRMNPDIRAVMRMFDQKLASKISGALTIDAAFSSSALAAPVVAAMAFQTRVLSTLFIGGEPHVIAEVTIEEGSSLAGRTVGEIEAQFSARVLAQTPDGGPAHSPPKPGATLTPGDLLVVHTSAQKLSTLSAAGRRERG